MNFFFFSFDFLFLDFFFLVSQQPVLIFYWGMLSQDNEIIHQLYFRREIQNGTNLHSVRTNINIDRKNAAIPPFQDDEVRHFILISLLDQYKNSLTSFSGRFAIFICPQKEISFRGKLKSSSNGLVRYTLIFTNNFIKTTSVLYV